ncbi:MAG: Lrp/AsnC family transcriptional regulator [Chloroflexota bacterium]
MKESDVEILKILEQDARISSMQIATMLDLPEEEVRAAIKRLETEKIIRRYKTVINWEKVEEDRVLALIEVRVTPQRDVGFDAIAERIYRFPEARTVYLLSGTYDLLVQVAGRSMKEVANFVSEKLAPLEGVQGTVTHFLLKRYKEDGDVLAEVEGVKRLPVTP